MTTPLTTPITNVTANSFVMKTDRRSYTSFLVHQRNVSTIAIKPASPIVMEREDEVEADRQRELDTGQLYYIHGALLKDRAGGTEGVCRIGCFTLGETTNRRRGCGAARDERAATA